MIVVVLALLGILSVPLFGGRLRRLASLDVSHLWIVWVAMIVQTVLLEIPTIHLSAVVGQIVHLATYAAAFGFIVLNRHVPGALMIGVGAACNAAAIAANGGVMPASPGAWETAGLPELSGLAFENSNINSDANLAFLGDVFAIPAGWPLANVFSIGDVIIVVAATYLAHVWCRRTARSNAWPAPRPSELVDIA